MKWAFSAVTAVAPRSAPTALTSNSSIFFDGCGTLPILLGALPFLAGIARLAWGAGATGPICRARVLHAPGCGARRGRRAAFYPFCRLEARIIVVDPGFMVDPGYPRAPDPPRSPDPPR